MSISLIHGCSATRWLKRTRSCSNAGRFTGAKFQYLAANVLEKASGKTILPPYAVKTFNGAKVGFMLMPPPKEGDSPVSLGGESLPFAITSKSKNKDVAAAYIDFLTNAQAGAVLTDTNNLPAMKTEAQPSGGVSQDVAKAWTTLNEKQGLVPYLDYATPTFFDDVSGAIQKLLAEKDQPKGFTQDVQKDYSKFTESM
jgi:raffinose/stachyose/melibiose transport system substrate-binding protein